MKTITPEWLQERCTDDCGCLIWKLQVSRDGAPITRTTKEEAEAAGSKRSTHQVRRLAWSMRSGRPVPKGMLVTYTCNNPRCLTCLDLMTPAEVIRRTWSRPDSRAIKVAAITKASRKRGKLDMEKARHIRQSAATLKEVSEELGISMTLASSVRRGLAWREDRNPFAALLR